VNVSLTDLIYSRDCSVTTTTNTAFETPRAVIEWNTFHNDLADSWNGFIALKGGTMVPTEHLVYNSVQDEFGVECNFQHNVVRRINKSFEGLKMSIIRGTGNGFADFYAERTEPRRLVPIEVKTKYSQPYDSLYESRENENCIKIINQIFTYIIKHKARFGIVTTFDLTFFLRTVQMDDGIIIQVSPPVGSKVLLPTLASFFFWASTWELVNYDAVDTQMLPPDFDPEDFDPEDCDPPSPDRHDPSDGNYHSSKGSTMLSSNSSNRQTRSQTQSRSSNHLHTQSQTSISISEYIGSGAGGIVYEAFIDGKPVALKVVNVNDKVKFSQLLNEVAIYNHLRDIQGIYIPKLLCHGYLMNKDFYAIAMTLCSPMYYSTDEEKKNILKALCERGVFHQDIRNANFVRSIDGKLFILDFGQCILKKNRGKKTDNYLHSLPIVSTC
jgi:hypothetical protein